MKLIFDLLIANAGLLTNSDFLGSIQNLIKCRKFSLLILDIVLDILLYIVLEPIIQVFLCILVVLYWTISIFVISEKSTFLRTNIFQISTVSSIKDMNIYTQLLISPYQSAHSTKDQKG